MGLGRLSNRILYVSLFSILFIGTVSFYGSNIIPEAYAGQANANLIVSAEDPAFLNTFAGSMVIEVIVDDPSIVSTVLPSGEPDVTVNGKNLRMAQASDGRWHGYFVDIDMASIADGSVGLAGFGLDFGQFCGQATTSFGPSFSDTIGIAIPRPASVTGSVNGPFSFPIPTCTTSPSGADPNENNVVRNPPLLNIPGPALTGVGQIGLDQDAWPLIQLYDFNERMLSIFLVI